MKNVSLIEVMERLVGPIEPLGCSARDPQRLENVKKLRFCLEHFTEEMAALAEKSHSYEHSVSEIGRQAQACLDELREIIGLPEDEGKKE